MPLPEVVVTGRFTTENEPSQGTVTFTDNYFSVSADETEIYTPVRVTGYLDQSGFVRCRLPLNIAPDSTPQPRSYHCVIAVAGYATQFDFVITPAQLELDLATIIPVSPVPVIEGTYVSSVAGMSGNITAEELATKVGQWSPAAGDSAYELWLKAGNVGTLSDFFNAYKGTPGDVGLTGAVGPNGVQGIQGIPGPAGPQGADFTIEGVVDRPSDLPDGYPRYTVFVTTETKEYWLNAGNDQWQSLGSYAGEPGAPGDVTGGQVVGTNYFISPEPSRLDGWTADFGNVALVASIRDATRTAIRVLNDSDQAALAPLRLTSPQTGVPSRAVGDKVWISAWVYSNLSGSPDVRVNLFRRSTHTMLETFTVTAGPLVGQASFGYTFVAPVPANDLYLVFERTANAGPQEQLRVSDIMVTLESAETSYFDGSYVNDENFNYNWRSQEGYSVSTKTTVTTKAKLNLDNVDNTHDLDKPISTATQVALDDVRENAGKVKSVNLQIGDVIVDKNSVGLDQVANLAPLDLPISTQVQQALDALGSSGAQSLAAKKLVDLADVSKIDVPVNGDVVTWVSDHWEYKPTGNAMAVIPGAADLNAYLTSGAYIQPTTANAANGSNYPVALAGLLRVDASDDGGHIWQRYTAYGRGGAVDTDIDADVVWQRARYNGTWTLWKPQAWGKNEVWNNAASGWNGLPNFADMTQNWGDEVYLDSAQRLRSRPQHLNYDAIKGNEAPSVYPTGLSIMGVSSSGGFTADGISAQSSMVITFVRNAGSWAMQLLSANTGDSKLYHRFGSGSTWGPWKMVAGNTYSPANPLVAYSGWAMNSSYMQVHGHTVQLYGSIKRTGATITSGGGDITNTNMCYIASGLPYPVSSVGFWFTGGDTLFGGVCGSDRVLTVSSVSPGRAINSGNTYTFATMFLSNTV